MAKFKAIHGEMSGSIADNTWSHNKGGAYVRQRRVPTNPTTTRQTAVRAILGSLSSSWAGLSSAERDAWNAWASLNPVIDTLGTPILLSGQQAYVKLNSRLVDSGAAAQTSPPPSVGPTALIDTTTTATAPDSISIAFTATPLPADTKLAVWMTAPGSPGRDPNFNQARLVGYSSAAAASPVVLTTPWGMATGQEFNLFYQLMDANGQVTAVQKERVTVP